MKETQNQILIQGDPRRIFELAWAVEEWPRWLPHYRWVRVLGVDGDRRTVEMAASRTGWPVKWISHQWRDPERLRIRFRHVGGVSRGMDVEWRIEPAEDGVHVSIRHDLSLEVPVIRSAPGRWVVGEVFVKAVASRTLACLKARVEAEGQRNPCQRSGGS
jgi:ribosome-associated toxin RatA of RatAB toxin-antitoxin module